jgi:hypothetical protein
MILMRDGAKSGKRARWDTRVHLTETADDDLPHLVTNVETTAATSADNAMTEVIHSHLAERDLLRSRTYRRYGLCDVRSFGHQ